MKKNNILFLSKSEIRGISIILALIIIVFGLSVMDFHSWEKVGNNREKEIMNFLNQRKQREHNPIPKEKFAKIENSNQNEINFHIFDPNKMSINDWKSFGLSDFQIKMLTNYISKGGKFRRAEDFSGIYGIDSKLYNKLKPYIQIDTNSLRPTYIKPEKRKFTVEINAASVEDMLDIPGIGPGFAKRIIAYKERLGGFTDSTQLMEVFGMDTLKYRQIIPYFVYQKDSIHKKEINKEDFRALIKHPYISKKIAYRIIQYRQQFGEIKNSNQLKKALQLPDKEVEKLEKYLKFN